MGRRRSSPAEDLFALLMDVPWWVSIALGVAVYCVMRWAIPAWLEDPFKAFSPIFAKNAWFAIIFVIPAIGSAVRSARKSRRLDEQTGIDIPAIGSAVRSALSSADKSRRLDEQTDIDSIRALPWKEFEELLGEVYRRKGYSVSENSGKGPDGGVDLTLQRGDEIYLVQCKQWLSWKVGVKVVREMLGLVTARRATGAIIVTSGEFTQEAHKEAEFQPVELIDGETLLTLIKDVQSEPSGRESRGAVANPPRPVVDPQSVPTICPKCGKVMVLRQAKRGSYAGTHFWGCDGYPNCKYIHKNA